MIAPDAHPCLVSSHVENSVGDRLAHRIVGKVVDVDFLRPPLRLPLTAYVPEAADELLLLRVDGDDWLVSRLEVLHHRADVLELRVAVWMIRALLILAQRVEAVAQFVQLLSDARVADHETFVPQLRCQIPRALARPAQWRHRIPSRRRRNHTLECLDPSPLYQRKRLSATAGPTLTSSDRFAFLQLLAACSDRRPRQTSCARNHRVAAVAYRERLRRCPQSACPFIQDALKGEVLGTDGRFQFRVVPHEEAKSQITEVGNFIVFQRLTP